MLPLSWINNLIQRDRFNVSNSCGLKRISSLITAVFLLKKNLKRDLDCSNYVTSRGLSSFILIHSSMICTSMLKYIWTVGLYKGCLETELGSISSTKHPPGQALQIKQKQDSLIQKQRVQPLVWAQRYLFMLAQMLGSSTGLITDTLCIHLSHKPYHK